MAGNDRWGDLPWMTAWCLAGADRSTSRDARAMQSASEVRARVRVRVVPIGAASHVQRGSDVGSVCSGTRRAPMRSAWLCPDATHVKCMISGCAARVPPQLEAACLRVQQWRPPGGRTTGSDRTIPAADCHVGALIPSFVCTHCNADVRRSGIQELARVAGGCGAERALPYGPAATM